MFLVLLIRSNVARLEESLAPASAQGPSPESSSDLGLSLFSSGDNAAQEQRGQSRFRASADGVLWLYMAVLLPEDQPGAVGTAGLSVLPLWSLCDRAEG